MRLSLAIRLGAMLRPQGKHVYFDGKVSCALGAACEAAGLLNYDEMTGDTKELYRKFPHLTKASTCPECHQNHSLWFVIGDHLNDGHGWTREAIADFVESIEPHPSPVAASEVMESVEVEA